MSVIKNWVAKQGVFNRKGLKLAIFTLTGLAIILGLAYLVSFTIHQGIRERMIIGIWMQVTAGFVLVIDQAVQRLKEANPNAFAKWFEGVSKKPSKFAILASLVLTTFLMFLVVCLSDFKGVTWAAVAGAIVMFFIWYDVYLYSQRYIADLVKKIQNKFSENHKRLQSEDFADTSSNLIIVIISSLLLIVLSSIAQALYTIEGFWIRALLLLCIMIIGFFVFPNLLLSIMYFAVWSYLKLFPVVKRRIPRVVFWAIIFISWTWGGALLLLNAYQS